MSFKKHKYTIIREAISKDLVLFIYNYFLMKRQVYDTCLKAKYISPYEEFLGGYREENLQVPNTYFSYADMVMETLMLKCHPMMEKVTGLKLQPAYSYARLYKTGDVLKRHKDRFSCEISTTMYLGGDPWPIYLSPHENVGLPESEGGKKGITVGSKAKGIKVTLKSGDMLIYRGCELEHWRNNIKRNDCAQVFLHYNDEKTPGSKESLFDGRPHLGLPGWFHNFNKKMK